MLLIYYSEVGVVIPILQVKDLKLGERLGFLNNKTKLLLTLDFLLNKVYQNTDKFVCFHIAYGYLCAPSADLIDAVQTMCPQKPEINSLLALFLLIPGSWRENEIYPWLTCMPPSV